MRIDRIELDGDGPVRGVFVLPPRGVAIWTTTDEIRESVLPDAVEAALWGPHPDRDPPPGVRRIVLGLTLDDGTSLLVERSLPDGALHVEGEGTDALLSGQPGAEIGTVLFGLAREEFLAASRVRPEDLRATPGDRRLRRLLRRHDGSPPFEGGGGPSRSSPDEEETRELAIARAALDTVESHPRRGPDPASTPAAGDLELHRFPGETAGTSSQEEDASKAPADRMISLHAEFMRLDQELAVRTQELQRLGERREELRSQGDRFGLLADAELSDVDRLAELAAVLRSALQRRDRLATEQRRFHEDLESRSLGPEALADLQRRFEPLDPADVEFLERLEETGTIRRGNAAITRSECRLDESRLQEIERERADAVRAALLPLGIAGGGLFGSLVLAVLRGSGIVSAAMLLLGLGAGAIAARLFWRARTRREDERLTILETLEQKRAQLTELEAEVGETEKRSQELARRTRSETPRDLREDWQRWRQSAPVRDELDSLAQRAAGIEEELAAIRTKVGAFRAEEGADPEMDLASLQSMIDDYERHFRARRDLGEAEAECARLESELTVLEDERTDICARMETMLATVGIDPERDLDEAIELYAARAASGELTEAAGPDAESAPTVEEPSPDSEELLDTSWIPGVCTAAEATLRRFLPGARELEIDAEGTPSLRLEEHGPRLDRGELERTLSGAAMDQVWLAVRLAIMETVSSSGERLPLFLDDPWARADDSRHARGLEWACEEAKRNQVVLRTSQEVRVKWFLHQYPSRRDHVTLIRASAAETPSGPADASASLSVSSPRR